MGSPIGRLQIDFDIALDRCGVSDLDNRSSKIWTGLVIPKARVQDANPVSIEGDQLIAQQPLVEPNRLEQIFGRRIGSFEKGKLPRRLLTPFRV